ncbi:tumor necrosis factor receptor superfamily member 4 [Thalassophryne amazonica]|uniref:tumor necrosis factor receptor superfamily member 4 n=1 Tax=Thalassophryne amazonica TaxID=390379 RepID=UPI001472336E|nr:tumor necrosis factor receptor superfamily member 4 [Thalassophryne amazonica]
MVHDCSPSAYRVGFLCDGKELKKLKPCRCPIVKNGKCEVCPDGHYQPEENGSQACKTCTVCNIGSGSEVKEPCTKTTDAKCQCRGQFVKREDNFVTCQCNPGFGLQPEGCVPCEHGYFSPKINSHCLKWKNCSSAGVKVPGSSTSNVVCNKEVKRNMLFNPSTTLSTTSHPRDEGAQTQEHLQRGPTTARAATAKNDVQPATPNTHSNFGVVLLIIGIVGLLALTAVTCKHAIIPCMQTYSKPAVKPVERKPIEESGDSNRSSLIKHNPIDFDALTSII